MGWFVCKTIPYLQGVSVNASINTLVAISAERCVAICYPMKWHITSRVVRYAVFIIWLLSLSITLPWALYFQLKPLEQGSQYLLCLEAWPTPHSENVYFVVANLVMCYLLPLVLISICYLLIWKRVCKRSLPGEQHAHGEQVIQRSKMKVIKMLMVVIILFACSWLPLYLIITRIKLGGQLSPREEQFVHSFLPVAQWLGASNSCINPILYAFFNRKFRAGFKAILSSRSCCSTLRYDYSTQMTISSTHGNNTVRKPPVNRMTISSGVPITKPKRLDTTMRSMSLRTPAQMQSQQNNNNFLTGQDGFKINNIPNAVSHDGTFV
ncbi:receptor [Nesidiocoris tenuis]|uniref:Receptor n=2 Tax=Nesidiocoris tenuis TaxID=355587 RepID=A0ABN7B5M5_9HEMI|nr:receptor [Nesidiocoris tenuis]